MTGREAYEAWAPTGARWSGWVRPVLFAAADSRYFTQITQSAVSFANPDIRYADALEKKTALIIDLPGYDSVMEGLAIAWLGWRPVPLFNGTVEQNGAMALVDNHPIISALLWGAGKLGERSIPEDAPPAFLLDSNRMNRHKMNVSVFDNSWDLYEQDIPSVEYMQKSAITSIAVRGSAIHKDLMRILYKFKKKGMTIFFTNGFDSIKEVSPRKPPRRYR